MRFWRTDAAMDHLARNADGDELIFVHQGAGALFCDYGHLDFRDGDYIVLPRGTMWRIVPSEPAALLLIEATGDAYGLPEKGLVGQHAIFDGAVLETPAIDDAFRAQPADRPWRVRVKRRGALSTIAYPHDPLDAVGWHGTLAPVRVNWRDIRPLMSHRLAPAALGAHYLCRAAFRRLHLRAASHRERPGRAQGAVLPLQRRLRRGDLLPPRPVHLARRHPSRHGDAASRRGAPTDPIPRRFGRAPRRRARRPTRSP